MVITPHFTEKPEPQEVKGLAQTTCLLFLIIFFYLPSMGGRPLPDHLAFKSSPKSHAASLLGSGSHQTSSLRETIHASRV